MTPTTSNIFHKTPIRRANEKSAEKQNMADSACRDKCNIDKKRQKRIRTKIDDDDQDDDDDEKKSRIPQNSLGVVFGGEVLLHEALPYLDAVSIVDKKNVCKRWKEKCDAAIDDKARQGRKKRFVDQAELRDAVKRYCEGKRDEIENIAKEYGYPIGKWDVSKVEDFSYVFYCMTTFNEDIGAWDVGNATNMSYMFDNAHSFNQSLSGWDVSNVESMSCMFCDAIAFNGDVSTWNTSSVTSMRCMFESAKVFNGDISAWDVSGVTTMAYMFWCATVFDGDISGWNVSGVTHDMGCVFGPKAKLNPDRLNSIKLSWEKQGKGW